jgi:hypothetical protein
VYVYPSQVLHICIQVKEAQLKSVAM